MDRIKRKLEPLIKVFTEAYQYSSDVYWIGYPDFSRSAYISPVVERIYGYSPEGMLRDSKFWDSCVHPDDLKHYHPLIEMAKRVKQEVPEARYNEVYRVIRADGHIRWILDRGHPIYSQEGECIGITGIATDVTERKICNQLLIPSLNEFPQSDKQRYYLRGRYHKIYLTSREANCAFYLLQGKTAKETAKILNLSSRTIEDVLVKIKIKFGVRYRSDVCEALIASDFFKVIF